MRTRIATFHGVVVCAASLGAAVMVAQSPQTHRLEATPEPD